VGVFRKPPLFMKVCEMGDYVDDETLNLCHFCFTERRCGGV
jgi:hypothetical protein